MKPKWTSQRSPLVPFLHLTGQGWQNCVRHTLSTFKNKTLVIMDKGQGGYHWSINPKKAEETNRKLKKAWNKNATELKASTPNPNFIERLVNLSVSKTTYSFQRVSTLVSNKSMPFHVGDLGFPLKHILNL